MRALVLSVLLTLGCRDPMARPVAPAPDVPRASAEVSAPAPDAGAPPDLPSEPDGGAPATACTPTDPRSPPLEVFVQPEAGEAPFVGALSKARTRIRVMVYLMGFGAILDTLKAKAAAGVDVRVILDKSQVDTNQKYFDALTAAGATVKWSDPKFKYMHAKVILADDAVAAISTGNYYIGKMKEERNLVARVEDPQDLAVLGEIFDADWEGREPDLACTRLLVSPVNARERLMALIDGATESVVVESMQLGDDEVRAALAGRHAAGVDVRVLLADPDWIDSNADAAAFLAQVGIPARWLEWPKVHVKTLVVDGARAYLGSENFSWTSLTKNREVGLITADEGPVGTILATFEKDWAAATPF